MPALPNLQDTGLGWLADAGQAKAQISVGTNQRRVHPLTALRRTRPRDGGPDRVLICTLQWDVALDVPTIQ